LFSFGCFGDVVHRCHHAVLVQGRPANHGCVRRASSLKCLCISVLHHDINKTVFDVFGVLGLCRLRWRHGRPIALVHMCVLAFMCDLDNVYVSESAARLTCFPLSPDRLVGRRDDCIQVINVSCFAWPPHVPQRTHMHKSGLHLPGLPGRQANDLVSQGEHVQTLAA
jgi:hypothetical protein